MSELFQFCNYLIIRKSIFHWRKYSLIFLCLLLSDSLLNAQYQNITFTHLNVNDGLSQSTIRAIHQDYIGFIWFGTSDGLNKYDGNKFITYTSVVNDSLSLPSGFINDIQEDNERRLWVSTIGGLCYLNRNADRFVRVYFNENKPDLSADRMVLDNSGQLWISDNYGTIYKKSKTQNSFKAYPNKDAQSRIQELIVLKNGLIWIGYEDLNLYEFDPEKETYSFISKLENEIMTMLEDNDRKIWLGMNGGGILTYSPDKNEWDGFKNEPENPNSLPNNTVRFIEHGPNNNLIISTNYGLAILNKNNWNPKAQNLRNLYHDIGNPQSISSNMAFFIFEDRNHTFWIGTSDAGINIWDQQADAFNHVSQSSANKDGLNSNVIWGFEEDEKGNFWVGTSKGLNYYNPKTGKTKHYIHEPLNPNSLPNNRVWKILKSDKNHFWIGSKRGITSMTVFPNGEPKFQTFYPAEISGYAFENVRDLILDYKNQLWAATENGFYLFDQINKTYKGFLHESNDQLSISGNDVRCVFEDSKRNIWVGTRAGLNLFNPEKGTFRRFQYDSKYPLSINDNVIRCIGEDAKGRLWIGTGHGLNQLIPAASEGEEPTFEALTTEDGLPNATVYTIESDDEGFLWLSTNNGLSKFNPDEKTFLNFHEHLGLQSFEFNSLASMKTSTGHLLYGGINGFNYFHPKEVKTDRNDFPIVFTDIQVNYRDVNSESSFLSKDINLAERIELKFANDKMFYFEFTVLDLLHANTRNYTYRLTPYQEDWIEVGKTNNVSYTNIPPDNYTFQVKYSDINGVWSDEIGEIEVIIQPAFWQTTWFRLSALILGLGLIYLWYRIRVRSIVNRQNELEKMVGERTTEIQQQKTELEQTLDVLKKAQIKLVESEKMASLGLLTAGVAHEINNPINYINTSAEALEVNLEDLKTLIDYLKKLDSTEIENPELKRLTDLTKELELPVVQQESKELLSNIKEGVDKVAAIVRSLKTFSYQSNGELKEADINHIIESALVIINNKIKHRDIVVEKHLQTLPQIKCDSGKLNQVFINVIDNALDAMNDDGILKINSFPQDKNVIIEILDNGKGMDETTLKRMFDPFFTTKEIGQGTGLGMAISYGIIQEQGGKITVGSELGKGTKVHISLPVQS